MAIIKEFDSSLLREKFVIHDAKASLTKGPGPVIAVSNRMVVALQNHKGSLIETFVIRTQNMHSCARMCARILQNYQLGGSISARKAPFDWDAAWRPIVNDFEQDFNPEIWCAVYFRGKPIYKSGEPHPFLDAIEKIDHDSKGKYEETIPLAEKAFQKTGTDVRIEYDGNVALVVHIEQDLSRCSIILRGPNKTTTFSFSAQPKTEMHINMPQCVAAAASFLEGIQLAFRVGMNEHKIQVGIIDRHSTEEKYTFEGRKRLQNLGMQISNLEEAYEVRYRPERPLFQQILADSKRLAQKIVKPPERKKDSGDSDKDDDEDIFIH